MDADTGAALPNVTVGIRRLSGVNGHFKAEHASEATTDANGIFRSEVSPGSYAIETRPQRYWAEFVKFPYTESDIQATDMDYRRVWYPGGGGMDQVQPLLLRAEGTADFGTIRIRKEPLYRVLVDVDSASCLPGSQIGGTDSKLLFIDRFPIKAIPCGSFLLTHRSPGDFELDVAAGADLSRALSRPNPNRAVLRYTVREGNITVAVRFSAGTRLKGRVVPSKDTTAPKIVRVSFQLVEPNISGPEAVPQFTREDGGFEFSGVHPSLLKLRIDGLADYFVQQVRYKGSVVPGGIFYFSGEGEVEIELGQGSARITGTVVNGGRPVAGADVVWMRWPAEPVTDEDAVRHFLADRDGKFQISGISPGEYRVFAVRGADSSAAQQPSAWQLLTARAEKLTLEQGGSRDLVVRLSEPSR